MKARVKSLKEIFRWAHKVGSRVIREDGLTSLDNITITYDMLELCGTEIEIEPINHPHSIYLYEQLNSGTFWIDEWIDIIKPEMVSPDWLMDAKILVSDEPISHPYNNGLRRHYAGSLDKQGNFLAWENGLTSWSAESPEEISPWKYAELAQFWQ